MSDIAATFVQKFVVEDAAGGAMRKITADADGLKKAVVGAAKAVAVGLVGHALKNLASDAIRTFEDVRKLAQQMGTTGAVADAMGDAFTEAGAGAGALQGGIRQWAQAMAAARGEQGALGAATEKWTKLGGNWQASAPEAMALVARRIGEAKSEQEKLVIATEHFGRAGRQMLPILSEGEGRIREIMATKGGLFSAENIAKARQYAIVSAQISDRWEEAKASIGLQVAPVLMKLATTALPMIEKAAGVAASAFGVLADHADELVTALKIAASVWAGMKIGAGAQALVAAATAWKSAAVASAAARAFGAPSGGISLDINGGPLARASRARALGLPEVAAGPTSSTGIGGALATAASAFPVGRVVAAVATIALPIALDWWASRKSVADGVQKAVDAGEKLQAEKEARAAERKIDAEAAAAKKLQKFSDITGIASDRLKDLGIDTAALGESMRQGGGALAKMILRARTVDAAADADKLRAGMPALEAEAAAAAMIRKWGGKGLTPEAAAEKSKYEIDRIDNQIRSLDPARGERTFFRGSDAATRNVVRETLSTQRAALVAASAEVQRQLLQAQHDKLQKIIDGTQNVTNINGPITITQDFKDADPDRVLFTVFDEIKRVTENRTTSRTLAHFGTAH